MKSYIAFFTILACFFNCISVQAQQAPIRPEVHLFSGTGEGSKEAIVNQILYADPERRIPSNVMLNLENNFSPDMDVSSFLPANIYADIMMGAGAGGGPILVGAGANADSAVKYTDADGCKRDENASLRTAAQCVNLPVCTVTGNGNVVSGAAGQAPSYTQIEGKCEFKENEGGCRCEPPCVYETQAYENCGHCKIVGTTPINCPEGQASAYATVSDYVHAKCVVIDITNYKAGEQLTNGSDNGVSLGSPQLGDSDGGRHFRYAKSGAAAPAGSGTTIAQWVAKEACKAK